jgi:hypothetical protein
MMAANEYNERGYWESAAFHEYHERLLQAAGTEWDLWTSVRPNGPDPEQDLALGAEFRRLLDQEFGDAPLFVMKDPRVCRLVPFWHAHLQAAGVEPLAIITVRRPFEVAASLAARDGLALDQALLLWLRHVLDAEVTTRALRRCIVRYRDLLEDWEAVAQRLMRDLDLQWPARSPEVDARITAFLGPDLHHHIDAGEAPALSPQLADWVTRTSEALDVLLEGDPAHGTEALAMLDRVRCEFDRATGVFGPSIERERRAQRRQAATADEQGRARAAVEMQLAQAQHRVADVERQLAQAQHRVADVERQLAQAQHRVAALQADVDHLARQHDDVTRELATVRHELSAQVASSDRRVHELEQSRTWRWSRPIRVAIQVMRNIAVRFRQ